MNKQTEVALKQIDLINQEIKALAERVTSLEDRLLQKEVRIKPKYIGPNIDKIIEGANIAMERLNKRGQK